MYKNMFSSFSRLGLSPKIHDCVYSGITKTKGMDQTHCPNVKEAGLLSAALGFQTKIPSLPSSFDPEPNQISEQNKLL